MALLGFERGVSTLGQQMHFSHELQLLLEVARANGAAQNPAIRQRIAATVTRRAPQVMVKVTGGGRGMGAIAAHFRCICKNGQLRIEDDRGVVREGKEAMHDLVDQWRVSGSLIPETSHRREAFNMICFLL